MGFNKMMFFFTPCEELKGGSIFIKLSSNHKVIHPYVEKADASFMQYMNENIKNMNYYLKNENQKKKS